MPKSARPLALGLLALLLVACGGGTPASAPTPAATPGAAATPVAPAEMPTPLPAPITLTPATRAEGGDETTCADPYPEGAPHETEPGEAIRLRPTGSPPALAPYQPLAFATDPALEQAVRASMGGDEGRFAVVVKDLAGGRGVALAPERTFYAASLFKTWVMLEAYHQREAGLLDFEERYVVSDHYQEFGLSAGELAACSQVTLGEALQAMVRISDNVAANLLLDRVGAGNVSAALRSLGLSTSGIPADGSLPTTAADMVLLLEAIARRQAVSEGASDQMLALLASQTINDRLPALLPPGTLVAHKTGNWSNATHDAGVIFSPRATYVIVVLTDFGFGEDGATRIARLSRTVYDYYNPN